MRKLLKKSKILSIIYIPMCKQGRRNYLFQASPEEKSLILNGFIQKKIIRDSFLPIELQLKGYCRLFLIWKYEKVDRHQ